MKRLLPSTTVLVLAGFGALPASSAASSIVYRCGSPANLCRINPDGTGQQQLTTDGSSAAYHGASIDLAGDRMVFTRDTEDLFAADGNAQNVVGPISRFSTIPKISFDGTMVADSEYYPSLGENAICTFQTTPSSDSSWGRQCSVGFNWPAFGPGGEIVASGLSNGHDRVCAVVIGSGCSREVAVDPSHDLDEAAVSPDGQTLAAVAITAGGSDPAGGSIVLYSMSSGQLVRTLTNGTTDETPAWSPDGSQLVFARDGSLYTIAAGGSHGSERLLVSGGDTPTWGGPASTGTGGTGGTAGTGGTGGTGGNGAHCTVPRLGGLTLTAARSTLKRAHCALGSARSAFSSRVARGHVISQSARPGTTIAPGSRVNVLVSKGRRPHRRHR